MGDDERAEELAIISDEVARMGRLVDDLLALARLDAGPAGARQPLEISSLLQEAAARGRMLGERSIVWTSQPGLWVSADPDQLTRALLNLVSNAVAHTTPGGHVSLVAAGSKASIEIAVLQCAVPPSPSAATAIVWAPTPNELPNVDSEPAHGIAIAAP